MINLSPDKSPDLLQRQHFHKLRSPERSPILTRRSRSHERSSEKARQLRELKHRSLEIPHIQSRSPDMKPRSHTHEGSSDSPDRLISKRSSLDIPLIQSRSPDMKPRSRAQEASSESPDRMMSTPIPIPVKAPLSQHSASSSEITLDKSSPHDPGDDTIVLAHSKTESEDSLVGSEALTPKLEEPVFPEQIRTGEMEQLPTLPEETLMSPDSSRSLKLATVKKKEGTGEGGSEDGKSLDEALFEMLDSKESSVERSLDKTSQEEPQGETKAERDAERKEKTGGGKETQEHEDILAKLDELLDAVEEDDEEEESEEEEKEKEKEKKGKLQEPETGRGEGKEMSEATSEPVGEEPDKDTTRESEPDSKVDSNIVDDQSPTIVEPERSEGDSKPEEGRMESSTEVKGEPQPPSDSKPDDHETLQVDSKPPEVVPDHPLVEIEIEPASPSVEFQPKLDTNVDSVKHETTDEVDHEPEPTETQPKTPDAENEQSKAEPAPPQKVEPKPPGVQVEPSKAELKALEDVQKGLDSELQITEGKQEPSEAKPELEPPKAESEVEQAGESLEQVAADEHSLELKDATKDEKLEPSNKPEPSNESIDKSSTEVVGSSDESHDKSHDDSPNTSVETTDEVASHEPECDKKEEKLKQQDSVDR